MSISNDLTKGSIPKQLLKFSAPLVLSSFLQSVYGMVDMIIAGRMVGSVGLSAINNSSMIMLFLTQILMGTCTGGNILISQYFGAGDKENSRHTVATLFTSSIILGAVMSAALLPASHPLLVALAAPALDDATGYLAICAIGVIFIAGYNATSAIMRSYGNSKAPLICVAVSCILNTALDIIFVGPFGWGVAGAAIATVISQAVSFVVSLIIVLRHEEVFGLSLRRLYMRGDKLKLILKLGIPVCIQMTVANISWLSVMYLINGYGVVVSAGNGVSVKIKNLCLLFITAMSSGATAMIAQNVGAKEFARARKVVYDAMLICVGVSAAIVTLVELFASPLSAMFTSEPDTIAVSVKNLRIEIASQLFYAVFQMYHALALGVGHTWFVLLSSFINCILVRLVLIFILNSFIGLTGIYIACLVAPASSVPIGFWYDRSNRWRRGIEKNTYSESL